MIIMAAGSGTRMGAGRPKQFLELEGKAILQKTIEVFLNACPGISVITVLPQDFIGYWREYCLENNFVCPQILVPGGITRFHSVRNALDKVPEGTVVAIHDAVRPLVTETFVKDMFEKAETTSALIPVIPCVDTMKVLEMKKINGEETLVTKEGQTVDRSVLYAAQTPQIFHSEMLKEAYEIGCRDFGENKVQELIDKYEVMPKDIRWHMIGHLQRNKVKYIVDKVYLIHSVDSLRLAEEISKEAVKKNVNVSVLIEVNAAGEETKFGTTTEEAKQLVRDVSKLPNVYIKGLMTIAPMVDEAEENRQFFQQLKKLSVDIAAENIDNVSMDMLSMGMSGDFETAIEEGATHVRVGTSIFGVRNYAI